MDAIGDLIGALLHLLFLAAEAAVRTVVFVFEYVIYGRNSAIARRARRRDDGISPLVVRLSALVLVVVVLSGTFAVISFQRSIHKQRIAQTEELVDRLADEFYRQTLDPEAAFVNGRLNDQDAWDQPLTLETEKSLFGWSIVVRSDGPDGRPATADDVQAVRSNWNNLEQVGGELVNRGKKKVTEKIKGLFKGNREEEPRLRGRATQSPKASSEVTFPVQLKTPRP